MRRLAAGLAVLLLLVGCYAPLRRSDAEVPSDSVCDAAHEGKHVAVEGYLKLPDRIDTKDSSIVIWLVDNPISYHPLAGVELTRGNGPNKVVRPDGMYRNEDLDVKAFDGRQIRFGERVRISGTPQKPLLREPWGCRIVRPYVEKV